jgi:hypothetical protein
MQKASSAADRDTLSDGGLRAVALFSACFGS